jgi:hypothetical protein
MDEVPLPQIRAMQLQPVIGPQIFAHFGSFSPGMVSPSHDL